MNPINRLYLDTNIFIAMAEGANAISTRLHELIDRQLPGAEFLSTSELSIAELLVHPFRRKDEELIQLYDNWINSGAWLTVGPVDRSVLWCAARVRGDHGSIKLPDAIHISTAIGFGCTHFLTADKRLPSKITVWNERWGITKGPAAIDVLILDDTILRRIIDERSKT